MSGQTAVRSNISAITNAEKCQITTSSAHGLSTGDFVRVTGLGNCGLVATDRGFEEIDAKRYKVYVTSTTEFYIRDPITSEYVNSTDFTTYVEGGQINLEQTAFEYAGE